MTEGIDVASPQADISFKRVAAAGIHFVAVKAGGAQTGTGPYIAPHYAEQIDAARPYFRNALAHYWVTGALAAPAVQASFLAERLHHFGARDAVMLDNEPLDSHPKVFTAGECVEFFTQLHHATGIDYQRMWLYLGDATFLGHDWAPVRDLGVQLVRARYGVDDGTRHSVPAASWPYSVHQYTSRGQLWDGGPLVDRDYSPLPVGNLFPANRAKPKPKPVPAAKPAAVHGQQEAVGAVPAKLTPVAAVPTPAKPAVTAAPVKPAEDVTALLREVLAGEGEELLFREDGNPQLWILDGTHRTALTAQQAVVYQAGGARVVTVAAGALAAFAVQ